ncbi:hypothetical protein HDV06_001435 [Boothiomyces sp. JEL0866]|nr:hypothetical protein HDV06_001435 [Boothiomyces sp. JEL0866]
MKPRDSVAIGTLENALKLEYKAARLETAEERSERQYKQFFDKARKTISVGAIPMLHVETQEKPKKSITKTVKLQVRPQYGSKSLLLKDKFDYIAILSDRIVHNSNISTREELFDAHKKFLESLSKFEHRKKAKFLTDQISNRSLQSRSSESAYSEYGMPSINLPKKKKREKESEGENLISRLNFTLNQKHPSEAHKILIENDRKLRLQRRLSTVDEIFQIMSTSSRSHADLVAADDYLRNLPAFSNIPDYILSELWKLMISERFEEGEVIFRQGDPGTKWYVILQGTVKLYLNKGISSDGKAITNYLTTMTVGEKFGDQALFNDLPRSATVIASSDPTFMLTLEKTHFLKLMGKAHLYNQKNLIVSLKKFRFLDHLDMPSFKLIAERMVTRKLTSNSVILKQGSYVDNVFFILSGKCAVFRKVKIPTDTGKKITKHVYMGVYGPNSTFNEQAAFTDRKLPSPVTVIVQDPSEIVSIVTNGEWLNLRLNFETTTLAKLDPFDLADIKDAPEVELVHDFPKNPFAHFNIDEKGLVRINITNKSDLTKTVFGLTGIYTDKDDAKKVITKMTTEKVQIIVKPGKTQFLKYKFMPQPEAGEYGLVVLVDYYDSEEPAYKSVGCIDTIKIVYSDSLFDLQSISIYLLLIGVVVGLIYIVVTPSGDAEAKTSKPKVKKAAPAPVKKEDSQTEANMEWIPDHVANTHKTTKRRK